MPRERRRRRTLGFHTVLAINRLWIKTLQSTVIQERVSACLGFDNRKFQLLLWSNSAV
jgi:hypothetical protein